MSSRSNNPGVRDTAKDIMYNLNPSGPGGREPRTGKAVSLDPPDPGRKPPLTTGDPMLEARLASAERGNRSLLDQMMQLQQQMRQNQRQHDEAMHQEQESRRRLEAQLRAQNDAIGRLSINARNGEQQQQDIDATKQAKAALEAQVLRLSTDISHLKRLVDQHSNDLMALNGEVRSRPVVDPQKIANNSQQMIDARIRDLHGEVMALRQAIDQEVNERRRNDQEHVINLNRLQSQIADQDGRRTDLLKQLAKNDKSQEFSAETKRLNEKIQYITDEVTRTLGAKEQKIREENSDKYLTLEKAIKAELEARLQYEKEVRAYLESRYKNYENEMDELRKVQQGDRSKNKEKFLKLNEALAVIEKHLEQGNRKVDRVMAAEIQSRKLHEKGLLSRLTDIEEKLNNHTGALNRQIEAVREASASKKKPKDVAPVPELDNAAIKKELEAIANDKQKMTMEGMLKLEEKLQRIERGLSRDTSDLKHKMESTVNEPNVAAIDSDALARLRHQVKKLTETQEEIEKSHEKMKDRIERQIPEDIEEVSLKVDNAKRQLEDKIEAEERQRHLQVKELQNDVARLKNRPVRGVTVGGTGNANATPSDIDEQRMKRLENDINEAQVGVKKLAESVTTVKNVLSRRIDDEARNREKAIDRLEDKIRS